MENEYEKEMGLEIHSGDKRRQKLNSERGREIQSINEITLQGLRYSLVQVIILSFIRYELYHCCEASKCTDTAFSLTYMHVCAVQPGMNKH